MYIKDLIEKLILEEIERMADYNKTRKSNIAMNYDDFIRLTTSSSNDLIDIKNRAARLGPDAVDTKKFAPYLEINNNNQVVAHEGRARFYYLANILDDGKSKDDIVFINLKKGDQFLKSSDNNLPRTIYSQGDGRFKVSIDYESVPGTVVYKESNQETEIRIPKTLEDLFNDISNTEPEEMIEKFRDNDYAQAAYERSAELEKEVEDNPVEALVYYKDVLLFAHKNSDLNLEDPIRYLAERSLLEKKLEENKKLIDLVYEKAGDKVGDALANAFLKAPEYGKVRKFLEDRDPAKKQRRDDIYDLNQWIRDDL